MLMVNDVMVTDLVSAKADIIEGGDPEKTLVREIMFKPLIVTSLETSLEEAIEAMFKHKIKKLPVIEGGKLVGLVTFTDIAHIQPVMEKTTRKLMEKYDVSKRISKVIRGYIA